MVYDGEFAFGESGTEAQFPFPPGVAQLTYIHAESTYHEYSDWMGNWNFNYNASFVMPVIDGVEIEWNYSEAVRVDDTEAYPDLMDHAEFYYGTVNSTEYIFSFIATQDELTSCELVLSANETNYHYMFDYNNGLMVSINSGPYVPVNGTYDFYFGKWGTEIRIPWDYGMPVTIMEIHALSVSSSDDWFGNMEMGIISTEPIDIDGVFDDWNNVSIFAEDVDINPDPLKQIYITNSDNFIYVYITSDDTLNGGQIEIVMNNGSDRIYTWN